MRVEDKQLIGELLAGAPPDLQLLGSVDFVELIRSDREYWQTGLTKLIRAAERAAERATSPRAASPRAVPDGPTASACDEIARLRMANLGPDGHAASPLAAAPPSSPPPSSQLLVVGSSALSSSPPSLPLPGSSPSPSSSSSPPPLQSTTPEKSSATSVLPSSPSAPVPETMSEEGDASGSSVVHEGGITRRGR